MLIAIVCSAEHCDIWLCILTDVSIEILEELDLTHLRATGLQSCEEELPEAEQAPPGIFSHWYLLSGYCRSVNLR